AILSHWITGIHRIRIDSSNPLSWDLAWFFVFGVVPAVIGLMTRRGTGSGHGTLTASALAAATLAGGIWAAQSPAEAGTAIAVFRPGLSEGEVMQAIGASGGSLVWQSRGIWAVQWTDT